MVDLLSMFGTDYFWLIFPTDLFKDPCLFLPLILNLILLFTFELDIFMLTSNLESNRTIYLWVRFIYARFTSELDSKAILLEISGKLAVCLPCDSAVAPTL
jgi:hypothetical protein